MDPLLPPIDQNVPLPTSFREAMPDMTPREELEMRARTIKLLADLTGAPIEPDEAHRGAAVKLATDIAVGGAVRPDMAVYPNETIAYLAGLVAQYDSQVVRELADLKRYVVNKLIEETNNPDGKVRMQAIKSLGEVDGVDAFKKRSEVVVKQQSLEEVEKELLETIAKLESRTIDLPMVEIAENGTEDEPTNA